MAAARLWRRDSGWKSIAAIGALGGLILTFLATRFPDLARLVGHVESALDAISRGTGGLARRVNLPRR